ncbi:hypothetical protein [Bradyrhizobium sp. JYMT SZCCT0428]|uniref:hypothetical protein n=1 Tax=Bradyrhizobium sp. JYMT SZCCT0428 TaxID=2807673 RepID=UPI001BA45B85|nr:hypothetical protein [Bradyrhizobium sp. JYMT SZCCT0428]MBR1155248.1 hypothetical protein [Bradyrhizobium sp. JYMT SZCCT0428]
MTSSPQRALTSLDNAMREAIRQSRLAYEYYPNSYTYGSLNACLAALNALNAIRSRIEDEFNPR